MRRSQACAGTLLAAVVALSLTASAAPPQGGAVALFDFGGPPRSARAGKYLAKRLRAVGGAEFGKAGRTLMPRSKMLSALGLDGDLCVRSGACDPEVDKGLGVAHVVHGELAKEGDYRLSTRLQDATSGKVLRSSEIRARAIDGLADRLPDVWRDLFGDARASAPRRVAPAPSSAPTAQARKPTTTASNAHGTVVVRGSLSTQGRGRMDPGQLATAVDRQMPQVHRCYGQQLEQDPSVSGGLSLTIEISARGSVKGVTLQEDVAGGAVLAACLRTRARAWKLPKPWGGALTLSVPLELSPRLTSDTDASATGDDSDDLSLRQQFGTIDPDAVEGVVIGHIDQVQRCFVRGWKRDASLKGGLTVKFRIALSGRVEKADIVDDELGSDKVSRCIRSRVLSWRFPRPSGGPAVVHYPFSFG